MQNTPDATHVEERGVTEDELRENENECIEGKDAYILLW